MASRSSPSLEVLHSVSQATAPADAIAYALVAPPPADSDAPPPWWALEGLNPAGPCLKWHYRNLDTGATAPFLCRSWKCPICAWRKARSWLELLEYAPIERHVVITRLGPDARDAHRRLQNIIKALRRGEAHPKRDGRRSPQPWEYLATMEKHTRAGVHTHLLQHGAFTPQRSLSRLLERYGAGRVAWVERIAGDTMALARYVTRHLIAWQHPYQPKVGRRLTYSRHFWGAGSPVDLRSALHPTHGSWALIKAPLETPNAPQPPM